MQKSIGMWFKQHVASFDLFFREMHESLLKDVFLNAASTASRRVDTSTGELAMRSGHGKGGTTYMTPSEREKYHLVYANESSDVFKMSLAPSDLIAYSLSPETLSQNKQYVKSIVDIDIITNVLRDYEQESSSKRLWCVTRLVAIYMGRVSNSVSGDLEFCNHMYNVDRHVDAHIDIYHGELFSMMVCITFALFESLYFSDKCRVNACFETYNGKTRVTVPVPPFNSDHEEEANYEDTVKTITQQLYARQDAMSTAAIVRFAAFCRDHLHMISTTNNELVYGVGIQYVPETLDDVAPRPLFGCCPAPLVALDVVNSENNDELDPDCASALCDPSMHNKDHNSPFGVLQPESIRHKDVFNTFRVIPQDLQPHTLSLYKTAAKRVVIGECGTYLYRVQHYHVTSRKAAGVFGMNHSYPDLAGDFQLNVHHESTKATSQLRLDSLKDYHMKMDHSINRTLRNLQQFGNIPRVEIACIADSVNASDSAVREYPCALLSTVRFALSYVRRNTACYEMDNLISLVRFYWLGVSHRFLTLLGCLCDTRVSECTYQQLNVITLEVAALSKYFYNGLRMFSNEHAVGRFVGFQTDRPFLSIFPDEYRHMLWRNWNAERSSTMVGCKVLATFFSSLSLTEEQLNQRPSHLSATQRTSMSKLNMKACSVCYRVMTDQESVKHFDGHPCCESLTYRTRTVLSLDSAEFVANLRTEMEGLNELQRRFVNDAVSRDELYFGKEQYQCHLLLTGKGGAGKSKTVRVALQSLFKRFGQRVVAVVCSTKIASTIVGGTTLCSFLGIINDDLDKYGASFSDVVKYYQQLESSALESIGTRQQIWANICKYLKYLFIDEASLISARSLDCLSGLLYLIKRGGSYPSNMVGFGDFGGVRVILSGDFLQLPPIVEKGLSMSDSRVYCFDAHTYVHSFRKFRCYYLSLTFRQQQGPFLDALNRLRVGDTSHVADDLEVFNNYCGSKIPKEDISFTRRAMERVFDGDEVAELKLADANAMKTFVKIRDHWLPGHGRVGGAQSLSFYQNQHFGAKKLSAYALYNMSVARKAIMDEREYYFMTSRNEWMQSSSTSSQRHTQPCLVVCSERREIQVLTDMWSEDNTGNRSMAFFPTRIVQGGGGGGRCCVRRVKSTSHSFKK